MREATLSSRSATEDRAVGGSQLPIAIRHSRGSGCGYVLARSEKFDIVPNLGLEVCVQAR
jgi:hypothetical protein